MSSEEQPQQQQQASGSQHHNHHGDNLAATLFAAYQQFDLSKVRYDYNVPVFTLDLDLKPEERWTHIVKQYMPKMKAVYDYVKRTEQVQVGSFSAITNNVAGLMGSLTTPPYLVQELKGVAALTKQVGLDFNHLYLLNVGYNYLTHCTSIAAQPEDSAYSNGDLSAKPLHLRVC